tara:strand:- start:89 stop:250 length:162 start_codon:yes stop_codon:yes gene_type:complete
MQFEINIRLKVDPDANFLETFGDNREVMADLIYNLFYDIDDTIILDYEVKNDK